MGWCVVGGRVGGKQEKKKDLHFAFSGRHWEADVKVYVKKKKIKTFDIHLIKINPEFPKPQSISRDYTRNNSEISLILTLNCISIYFTLSSLEGFII